MPFHGRDNPSRLSKPFILVTWICVEASYQIRWSGAPLEWRTSLGSALLCLPVVDWLMTRPPYYIKKDGCQPSASTRQHMSLPLTYYLSGLSFFKSLIDQQDRAIALVVRNVTLAAVTHCWDGSDRRSSHNPRYPTKFLGILHDLRNTLKAWIVLICNDSKMDIWAWVRQGHIVSPNYVQATSRTSWKQWNGTTWEWNSMVGNCTIFALLMTLFFDFEH